MVKDTMGSQRAKIGLIQRWHAFCKAGKRPTNAPANPNKCCMHMG